MSQAELIETIVREVLRRLAEQSAACACHAHEAAGSTLDWPTRLLTWRDVKTQLEGVQVLRVAPRTIITPEARDGLRKHGVKLEVGRALLPVEAIK